MASIISLLLSDGKEIEHTFSFVPRRGEQGSTLQLALKTPSPHYFAAHLPFGFLDNCLKKSRPKVIYMMRNPFDQLVSHYHFYRMFKPFGQYTGSWDEFYENFYKKNILFYGNHLDHVARWWKARENHKDHILYVKYEDMVRNPRSILNELASFLGKELSEDVMKSIVEQSSFRSMQTNSKVNQLNSDNYDANISPFMRKGTVGDWKTYFNEKQTREVEQAYEQKVKSLGLFLEREI